MTRLPGRPRVLVDCTSIPANRGGVGRYVEGLLSGMQQRDLDLVLVTQRRDAVALTQDAPWATVIPTSPVIAIRLLRLAWEQVVLPVIARRERVAVVHSPHYTFPLLWRGARVVTLHDATFFSDPGSHRVVKRLFFRWWTRRAWLQAHVVITPSTASAGEVERFLGAPNGIVEVAHLGVDTKVFRQPSATRVARFARANGLPEDSRWFAFLGTIEPRKSVTALLDAYALMRERIGSESPLLLISGARGWDAAAIAWLDTLPDNSGVVELGFLPRAELSALLGGSVAVVYPSVGEGFGLPVLEAMSTGAPVITTNRLAIPEVGGDAVVYVEPEASSILEGMIRVFSDPEFAQALSARAVARAATFSWRSTADLHVRAYRSSAAAL